MMKFFKNLTFFEWVVITFIVVLASALVAGFSREEFKKNQDPSEVQAEVQEPSRFEVIYREDTAFLSDATIYKDAYTGKEYLFVTSGYAGGLTELLGAEK